MAAPTSHNLHFFKVLMPGYDENLMIPVASSPEIKELKLSKKDKETALLRTRRSKDTLWKVDVCKREEDSNWCFSGDYWREFVKFHDLNVHEFLVFEHKGDLLFNVFIYDSPTDGDGMICEKEFPSRGDHERRRPSVRVNPQSRSTVRADPRSRSTSTTKASKISTCSPCFTTTMAESNLNPGWPYLNIPQQFIRSNKLEEHCGSTITLRHRKQKKAWPVKLCSNSKRTGLYDGWSEFAMSNELKLGDNCLMELDQAARRKKGRIIFDVRISRNENQ